MKKILLLLSITFLSLSASAQMMRVEELEEYAVERYGDKWTDAAQNIVEDVSLDKNKSLTYTQIIDCGDQTKEQLYVKLNYWFASTFNSANSVIQYNDKDAGVIVGKGYMSQIAAHAGGMNTYVVNISPIIKVDIKDGKVRVTYTVQSYEIEKYAGGGIMGALSGAQSTLINEVWTLENTFPFQKKDAYKAKKSSSKAFVMTHAYSNVMMDKIEEAVKHGIIGNENDDW